jgi:hypothetical protein
MQGTVRLRWDTGHNKVGWDAGYSKVKVGCRVQ